jgi:hypothetical protein
MFDPILRLSFASSGIAQTNEAIGGIQFLTPHIEFIKNIRLDQGNTIF